MGRSRRHIAVLLLHVFVWGGMVAPAVHWASHGAHNFSMDGAGVEHVRAAHEQQSSAGESRTLINSVIAATTHERADEGCTLCAFHRACPSWLAPSVAAAGLPALHAGLSIEPLLPVVAAGTSLIRGRAPPRA
jgi:hypothetical protein